MDMIKSIVIILFSTIFLSSCSMTTHVRKDQIPEKLENRLNYIGHNKLSQVMLTNGDVFDESLFKIKNDSIVITNSLSGLKKFVPLNDLRSIVYKDRVLGIGYGALVGGLASLISIGGTNEPVNIAFILGGGILIGSTCGYMNGSYQYYVFED